MRFKAATDDIFDTLVLRPSRLPIVRVFGVSGNVSRSLRQYAARYGITIIDPNRWPTPVLADPYLAWPPGCAPTDRDRRRLAWLSRSLEAVYPGLRDGSRRLPPPPSRNTIDALLTLHDRWSTRLWELLDYSPGSFERVAGELVG